MQGFIVEASKGKPNKAEANKQKAEEISAIQRSIVQYHLNKFCKANAAALAVIFKALIRGEAFYPKVQFLQDLSTEGLLCRKEKESQQATKAINQENLQNNFQQEEQPPKDFKQKESQSNVKMSGDSTKLQPKPQEAKNKKRESQENASKDSASNVKSQLKSSSVFSLNIEG